LPDSIWRNDGDALYVIQRNGSDVVVVEGFNPQTTVALASAALQAKKIELKPAARKIEAVDAKPARVSASVR
jgi:hypothetical protein